MPCRGLHFLVVEDEPFQMHAAQGLLKRLGAAAVLAADNGRSALKVLGDSQQAVDIVISDLSMPGMDGLELVRRLGEIRSGVSLVLASALETPLIAAAASLAQAHGVEVLGAVGKPLSAVKLAPLVELHRRRRAATAPAGAAFTISEIGEAWARGEFEPWYEPRVDLGTWMVRGVSARMFWQHPQHGPLPLERFLPEVQALGLEDDLAWLALQKAMAQCVRWQQHGLEMPITVTLPHGELAHAEFAARVQQLAGNEGLRPACVALGFPERLLGTIPPRALESLARLRMMGFQLTLQEFGSGPMEIERLSKVPWTELTVHDAVIAQIGRDEAARAVLAVALHAAQELRVPAAGCGIASQQQWELLKGWGCQLGQGSCIAQPMPPEALEEWLRIGARGAAAFWTHAAHEG